MIEDRFDEVYKKFKLSFYKNVLNSDVCREANLTVSEAFCAELISAMDNPSVGDLVEILKIAQPNITYRVNSLVDKGYVIKKGSKLDKRIVNLEVTDKYMDYQNYKNSYAKEVVRKTAENLNEEEKEVFDKILCIMDENFVPKKNT